MGIYIRLTLLPDGISQQEWEKVYEESLQLLKAYPFADIEERKYFDTTLPVYVQATERKEPTRHWRFCGDLDSKTYAETFKLYGNISNYQTAEPTGNGKDILLNYREQQTVDVFDSKTQGYDYHLYILAIAMLIESRFPKNSMVGGDLDYKQCIKAKQWADRHLSSPIHLPVRVSVEGLLSRFSHLKDEFDQIEVLEKWLIADQEKEFEIIYNYFSKETFIKWFLENLKPYSSPCQIGAIKLLIYYLNNVKDLNTLIYITCIDEFGPRFNVSEMIKAIARTWICLPHEKFSFMKFLKKIEGHPVIIERQFGMIVMDMKFTGREIQTHIPLIDVAICFTSYFPEWKNRVDIVLQEEISRIERALKVFYEQIRPSLKIADASTQERMYLADEDAFLYFNDDNVILTEDQELRLKTIAYSIKVFLEQETEFLMQIKQYLLSTLVNMKKILAGFATEIFYMILTERSWRWIDESEDTDLIRILLSKLILDLISNSKNEKSNADIRKAMFENKILTEKIYRYMKDEQTMESIRKWSTQTD
ncbi:hypothetical protein J2S09_004111 [Bacillus fengqiuensis]|nr:hypothetical protein [Bacillus fengqiuensis]